MKTTQQQGQREPSQVAARPIQDHYKATDEQIARLLEYIAVPIELPVAVDPHVPGIETPPPEAEPRPAHGAPNLHGPPLPMSAAPKQ